ncbi:type I restriction enzyme EcoKI specificity protein [Stutzerimonas stutzeri TS44]|nr:type I restriction enzyme EcoKI specificity protein [Stutzerimonas stutzeri TS44]
MSHYKPYPAYKDSGVEWLGRVPEHWEIVPLKYEAEFVNGAAFKPEQWSEIGTPIIRIENLNGSLNFNCFDGEMDARYHVEQGDLLFGWSGNRGTSFGPFIWPHAGRHYLNQHIFRICNFKFDKAWFYWSLKAVTAHVEDQAHGIIGMVHITKGDLGAIKIATPALAEQQAISAHLDRETARIDALIEKKTRFIELLREKRQALITHTVTKGLDPNVKMKDSGLEWLGEVPEHWAVKRLKFIAVVQTGIAKGKDNAEKDTVVVPYLRVANVQDGYLDLDEVATIEVSTADLPRYLLQPGDVLMNEGGDFDKLGRGHVWHGEIEPCIHQNHVFAVRPHGVSSEWLNTFTSSAAAQFYFMGRSKQSTNLASISSSNLMELAVPLPSEEEQRLILDGLHRQASQVNALLAQTERSIELLKERRSALITAAVTGQIDLRESA